jgi:hypothetical protein
MDIDTFWTRIDKSGKCWVWQGARCSKGYGSLGFKRKIVSAHRLAYELTHGPIPTGMHVLHHCDNPPCCNPDHLWLGTNADNVADRHRKGRSNGGSGPGELCGHAKLTSDVAKQIRELCASGVTQRKCAKMFGVHFGTVNDLVLRKTWRHV